MLPSNREDLARLLDQPDENIDLGRAALLLARVEYPDLELEIQVSRLDQLGAEAGSVVKSELGPAGLLAALRRFLAEVCGFRGNELDYYDPKNSFMNDVLDRRIGIPITLSIVYMEIGRRIGIPLQGVGLPGHFLVKYADGKDMLFLDPFHGGREVTAADCRQMVEQMYQGQVEFQQDFLEAVNKKYILLRMLNNLRGIYSTKRQFQKALAVVEMVPIIDPGFEYLKDRGVLHFHLRNYRQARLDLEKYLALNPQRPDAKEVRETLHQLRRLSAMLN